LVSSQAENSPLSQMYLESVFRNMIKPELLCQIIIKYTH
jgi:hypothetical protein